MNSCPKFSRFGGFAAVVMSLMLNTDNHAQDVRAPQPQAACPAAMPFPNLTAISPNGESYAMATPEGRIKFGSTTEGARGRTEHLCNPRALVFSPDGKFLAVAGGGRNHPAKIKVWRVADGTELCKVKTDAGIDPQMSFSPDGLFLVSTGEGSQINLWQLPKGTLKMSVTAERPVSQLAISKDGKSVIAVFADGSVQRFPVP